MSRRLLNPPLPPADELSPEKMSEKSLTSFLGTTRSNSGSNRDFCSGVSCLLLSSSLAKPETKQL